MIRPEARSRKELLWLSCKEKRCCSFYSVTLTGFDIWSISRALQLPPWAFTVYTDAPTDSNIGFALDASDKRFQVILAKRQKPEQALSPCVFLWQLPDGHAQCGLGDLRPSACKSFPSIIVNGIHCIGESRGCSCRVWGLAHMDAEYEIQQVGALERERTEYAEIIQRWNKRIPRTANDHQYSYMEFCNYLINAYADCYN